MFRRDELRPRKKRPLRLVQDELIAPGSGTRRRAFAGAPSAESGALLARLQRARHRGGLRRALAAPGTPEVPRDQRDEPRRVLHDSRLGPSRPALLGDRRAHGRRPASRRCPRARAGRRPGNGGKADLLPRERPPAEARGSRHLDPHVDRPRRLAARVGERALPPERPAGPHAARRGSRASVPVPLESVSEPRGGGEEHRDGRDEVRARQGAAGHASPPPASRAHRGQEEGQAREGRVSPSRVAHPGESRESSFPASRSSPRTSFA